MDFYKRVRELRKNHLHMTMADFGKQLGVSRDVINNIEQNRLAKPDQKISLIKLMCKEFNVNEDWLLNGNEPIFLQPDQFSLDTFMKERGATELETEIIKAYFGLEPTVRKNLFTHFKDFFASKPTKKELSQLSATISVSDLAARLEALERKNADLERESEQTRKENTELRQRLKTIEQEDGLLNAWDYRNTG